MRFVCTTSLAFGLALATLLNTTAVSADVDGEIPVSATLRLKHNEGKLIRAKHTVYRTHVVDNAICSFSTVSERDLSIIGLSEGTTHVTFWSRDASGHSDVVKLEIIVLPKEKKKSRRRR